MFTMVPASVKASSGASHTYTTWDPAHKGTLIVLSGGNLGINNSSGAAWNMVISTQAKTTGKWYAEFKDNDGTAYSFGCGFGVATSSASLSAELGSDAEGWGLYGKRSDTGHPLMEHSGAVTNYNTMTNGVTGSSMKVAYDADSGKVWLGQDAEWAGGGDPAAGTTPTFTVTAGTPLYLAAAAQNTRMSGLLNAGASAFAQPVPAGFNNGWYI